VRVDASVGTRTRERVVQSFTHEEHVARPAIDRRQYAGMGRNQFHFEVVHRPFRDPRDEGVVGFVAGEGDPEPMPIGLSPAPAKARWPTV